MPSDRPIDGVSFLPMLQGKPIVRKAPLFWYFYKPHPECTLRQGERPGNIPGRERGDHEHREDQHNPRGHHVGMAMGFVAIDYEKDGCGLSARNAARMRYTSPVH